MLPLELLHIVLEQDENFERVHASKLLVRLPFGRLVQEILGLAPTGRDADREGLKERGKLEDVAGSELSRLGLEKRETGR